MNSEIQDSLKQQVLSLERSDIQDQEQKQKLKSTCESLTETTNIDHARVAAVLKNLQEEQAAQPKRLLPFSLPAFNPVHTRIAVYFIAGFLAFSAYKSAQISEIQKESRYDHRTNNFKVTFSNEIAMFKSLLGDAQLRYHENYGRFPNTLDDLDFYYDRTTIALDSYAFVDEYNVLDDGSVKINLTENYGYNRWLKLTPSLKPGPLSDQVVLTCTSNAERNLLNFSHGSWCTHSG